MISRKGASSKAAPNTLCQKCLKRGHYSYECTASQQERPYISRPSRSQQLQNPKLAPKLTNDVLKEDISADKPEKTKEPAERPSRSNDSESDSVSTISTRSSRSVSPAVRKDGFSRDGDRQHRFHGRSRSPESVTRQARRPRYTTRSRSRSPYRESRNAPASGTSTRQRSISPYSKRVALGPGS